MKKTSLITRIAAITGLMLGAFALAVTAGTWTAPTCSPPDCNVDAPINVGVSAQTKLGALGLAPGNLIIWDGSTNVPAGSVLVADGTGHGGAIWGSASGSGNGIPNNIVVINSNQNWTVPAGVTKVRIRAWGGGGGGFCGGGGNTGAAGGDSGYAEKLLSVQVGDVINFTIGDGGSAGIRTSSDCGAGHPAPGPGYNTTATYNSVVIINAGGGLPALSGSGGPRGRGTSTVGDVLTYGTGGLGGLNDFNGNPGSKGAIVIEY